MAYFDGDRELMAGRAKAVDPWDGQAVAAAVPGDKPEPVRPVIVLKVDLVDVGLGKGGRIGFRIEDDPVVP